MSPSNEHWCLRCGRIFGSLIVTDRESLKATMAVRDDLRVMARNTRHFTASGILILDPWQDS